MMPGEHDELRYDVLSRVEAAACPHNLLTGRQYASALMTSPPLTVPMARHVLPSMVLLMNRTLPSASNAFTPPGW